MEPNASIGERLRQVREGMKLNQTDFAAISGATRQTQSNYEKGERTPDALYLAAIAAAGADVQYILTGQPMKKETRRRLDAVKTATDLVADLTLPSEEKAKLQEAIFGLAVDMESSEPPKGAAIPAQPEPPLDMALLSMVITELEAALKRHRRMLDPERKARAVSVLYEYFSKAGPQEAAAIDRVLELMN